MAMTKLFKADDLLTMEGSDRSDRYELIRGELREVSPASMGPSMIAGVIYVHVFGFVTPRALGFVTTADGGYILSSAPDTVVAPDVGFIKRHRVPPAFRFDHFCPAPPDLAVEVVSPSDRRTDVAEKVALYLDAGVPLIWVAWPARTIIAVHRPGQPVRELGLGDILDGEDVLPGFQVAVAEIFQELSDAIS